jgi:hypothetical protein
LHCARITPAGGDTSGAPLAFPRGLLGRAGDAVDLARSGVACELAGDRADAAGGRDHEDVLVGAQAGNFVDQRPSGRHDGRERGASAKRRVASVALASASCCSKKA